MGRSVLLNGGPPNEASERRKFFDLNIHTFNVRRGRPSVETSEEHIDFIALAGGKQFDTAIPPVLDPSGHAKRLGLANRPIAKKYSLYPFSDSDSARLHW